MAIIYVDDVDMASKSLFGRASNEVQQYFANSVTNYVEQVKNVAPQFAAKIQQGYNDIINSDTVKQIVNLKNRMFAQWQYNEITSLHTVEEIQQAPDEMVRWIMANPKIRELYIDDRLSGYDNSYIDKYLGVGKDHYDYRRVTENIIMLDEDGSASYTHYYEHIDDKKDILSVINKSKILSTWDAINTLIEESNCDLTSRTNGLM